MTHMSDLIRQNHMQEKSRYNESVSFVAKNYEEGFFSEKKAWRKLMPSNHVFSLRHIAAASVAVAVVTASAFIYNAVVSERETSECVIEDRQETQQPIPDRYFSTRIEFKDTPIKEVVEKIKEVYHVDIINVPDSELCLTLNYEGTAEELIALINELTGAEMEVLR